MYVTGTSFIFRRISPSAVRPIRCWISSKLGRPFWSRATISPSRMTSADPSARPMGWTSGYRGVMSSPVRLCSRTRPPST